MEKAEKNPHDKFDKRMSALKEEREPFLGWWHMLFESFLGYRGRFLNESDTTRGDGASKTRERFRKQLNNKGVRARRTLAAGMMAGITSPARPWFRLSTGNADMDAQAEVRQWLFQVSQIMYRVFSMSNFYKSLQTFYNELGTAGTAALGIFEDDENVIRCVAFTAGQFCLGENGQDRVDTFYRDYKKTAGQLVKEFGYENCPTTVRTAWDDGNSDSWFAVVHVIEPNDNRDRMSPMQWDMEYRSVYYVKGCSRDGFLRVSGFREFPIMVVRWEKSPGDVYATGCPGMTALGDTQVLQIGEKRLYKAIARVSDPSLAVPATLRAVLKGGRVPNPGEAVFVQNSATDKISEMFANYRPDINALVSVNDRVERRISEAFYEDLFLMLSNTDRRQMTAREVVEKHEEKLLQLGPVLESVHNEGLDPAIDRTFKILQRRGYLPEPPEALVNTELRVEYVSVLAQAQRLVSLESIERTADFTARMMALDPSAKYKFSVNRAIAEYAETTGLNPDMILSDDEVAAIVQKEAQAAQRQQMMDTAQQASTIAKEASQADMNGTNALTTTMRNFGLM